MSLRYKIKSISLCCIAMLTIWALWPVPEDENSSSSPAQNGTAKNNLHAKYTIKFCPGPSYLPDSIPSGFGQPLQGMKNVIRAFQEQFPDTRIEVVAVPTNVREYLVTQLSSGQAPDIVMVNVEDVWADVHKGWYIPLDGYLNAPNQFIREQGDPSKPGYDKWWDMFKYQMASRVKANRDGIMYCIPFDAIAIPIYYNKNLFAAIGAKVPVTWPEFMDILQKFQAYRSPEGKRVTPFLINQSCIEWASDMFFSQLYDDLLPGIDLLKDPVRDAYQEHLNWNELVFLHERGFFTREDCRYPEVWRIMHDMAQYCNKDIISTDVLREFIRGNAAMMWAYCGNAYNLECDPELTFEWGVFNLPHFTKETSRFASGRPMATVAGAAIQYEITNSAVTDTSSALSLDERMEQSERLKRVISFLQFITVPQNYQQIVNEYPCFMPNIVGVEPLPLLAPFLEFLERRNTSTMWTYSFSLEFLEVELRMAQLYLSNGISLDEFLDKWQYPNISASCARAKLRSDYNEEQLQQAWDGLSPARQNMEIPPCQ